MYRLQEIQDALAHVVGWEQGLTEDTQLHDAMLQSESGLTYQMAHPLMTLNNIASIMPEGYIPNYSTEDYPAWDSATAYTAGDTISYQHKCYVCITGDTGSIPTTTPSVWEEINPLSFFLSDLVRKGISKVVQTFTQMKKLTAETKDLLEHRTFFDGAGRLRSTILATGKIVGFEIVPVRSNGITAKINRIGLQMMGATGDVTMYLFHSSQPYPIATKTLSFTQTNGGFQWFSFDDLYLPYNGTTTDDGGAWYLCYNQSELPVGMEAIQVNKDWSKDPCTTCGVTNIRAWRELTKYLQISPFQVAIPEGWDEAPTLWDIADNVYTSTCNYGLNCEVSVGCDLTDFIISQRQVFQTALQRQVAYDALRTLAMNPDVRVNRNQNNASRMDILYELDGNTQGRRGGLGYELEKAYDALAIDTRGMDRLCLSCNNHGVRYTTA